MEKNDIIGCRGFLNIGDQHLAWEPPGRRKAGYWRDVMMKISQSLSIANEHKLVPLFLGDLFDKATDNPETLKTVFLDLVSKCWTKPIMNVGNHDISGARLSPADSLGVIAKSGHVRVIARSGVAGVYDVAGKRVMVGGTPFGDVIPASLSGVGGDVDHRIWLTHHDVGFSGSYPGSIDPFGIRGCELLLNGHMHLYRDPVDYDGTTWCNFGAITRTAIDALNEVPSAFAITPGSSGGGFEFARHILSHKPGADVFNMTGLNIAAQDVAVDHIEDGVAGSNSGREDTAVGPVSPSMVFINMMKDDLGGGVQTRSGEVMRTIIKHKLEEWGTTPEVNSEIDGLMDDAMNMGS